MSDSARVIRFPARRRQAALIDPEVASTRAREYLSASTEARSEGGLVRQLREPDFLSAVCRLLREELNTAPRTVAKESAAIYDLLLAGEVKCGVFDEHEFFLGETALLSAGSLRLLGDRDAAECWLDRAEAGYRHTINPAPPLAQVAYLRLAIRYDKRQYREVLELLPSALKSFDVLGLPVEAGKARFLRAMTFKELSRHGEALAELESLKNFLAQGTDLGLHGQVLIETSAYAYGQGRKSEAACDLRRALVLLEQAGRTIGVAHVHVTLGELLRNEGNLSEAVESYRRGSASYLSLGSLAIASYVRVLTAETLLAADRPREAEWEILQALPTIEEQKMVPEGFAAVALLRESVKRRKTDPNALRELREHLQKQN